MTDAEALKDKVKEEVDRKIREKRGGQHASGKSCFVCRKEDRQEVRGRSPPTPRRRTRRLRWRTPNHPEKENEYVSPSQPLDESPPKTPVEPKKK